MVLVLVFFWLTQMLPPKYKAQATILVKTAAYAPWTGSADRKAADEEVLKCCIQFINSSTFLNQAVGCIPLETDMHNVHSVIQVEKPKTTQLVRVSVTSADPSTAAKAANSIIDLFSARAPEVVDSAQVFVVERATVPDSPYRAEPLLAGGAVVCVSFLWVFNALMFSLSLPRIKRGGARYNVLHILPSRRLSGAERIVQLVTKHLNRERFQPVIVCSGDPLRRIFEDEDRSVEVADAWSLNLRNIVRLRKIIKDWQIDLIHAHDHRASLLAWLSAGLRHRPPVISHIHNTNPWLRGCHFFKLAEIFIRNRYDLSIACSDTVRDYFLRHNPLLKPDKILTVKNGIEMTRPAPLNRDQTRRSLGIPLNRFVFGTVGRLDEQKGIDVLLKAFKRVTDSLSEVSLLVVGTGPDERSLKDLTAKLGLEEHVIFTGYQEDVHAMFQVMDVFVLASRWEGLPMVLMEAMMHSVPVIASDVGGVSELVIPEETGLLVRNGDITDLAAKMTRLYADKALAAKLAENGHGFIVRNFDITAQVKKIENVYHSLLRGEPLCFGESIFSSYTF